MRTCANTHDLVFCGRQPAKYQMASNSPISYMPQAHPVNHVNPVYFILDKPRGLRCAPSEYAAGGKAGPASPTSPAQSGAFRCAARTLHLLHLLHAFMVSLPPSFSVRSAPSVLISSLCLGAFVVKKNALLAAMLLCGLCELCGYKRSYPAQVPEPRGALRCAIKSPVRSAARTRFALLIPPLNLWINSFSCFPSVPWSFLFMV